MQDFAPTGRREFAAPVFSRACRMIDTDAAIEALATIFEGAPEGAGFVTALGPNGAVRSTMSRDADRIGDFLRRHDRPGGGLYFCVGTLRDSATGRSKPNVGWITGLHADTDYKDHELTPAEILRRINQALLPASLIIETGGGLHTYWLLREAEPATAETVARVEVAYDGWAITSVATLHAPSVRV